MSANGLCGHHPLHPARVHELAAMAMQAYLSTGGFNRLTNELPSESIARVSYQVARAMLAEAEKEGK